MTAGQPDPAQADEILSFWFDELLPEQQFKPDEAIDQEIGQRFGDLHAMLAQNVPAQWRCDARSILAAIIVLDQFSRNLFRDDARAFAQDEAALALTKAAIADGMDKDLDRNGRQFLYMPLMHSEEIEDVELCAGLMAASDIDQGLEFGNRHVAVIARFGRYPARNKAMGRETTPGEAEFLKANPMGF